MDIYNLDKSIMIQNPRDLTILEGLVPNKEYVFSPSRHEYFIVKLVLLADYNLQNVSIKTGCLFSEDDTIEGAVTCLNTNGFDSFGNKFSAKISLIENILQPIYIGVSFKKAKLQTYKTEITVGDDKVVLVFNLTDELVFDEGFNEAERLARLKWLNSKRAWSNDVLPNYKRVVLNANEIDILGHKIVVDKKGMIEDVKSYYDESNALTNDIQKNLFYKPMRLDIEGVKLKFDECKMSSKPAFVDTHVESFSDNNKVVIESRIKYDGSIAYKINVSTLNELLISNLSLKLFFKSSSYFMGLENLPKKIDENFAMNVNLDVGKPVQHFFVGDVNSGAKIKLAPFAFNESIASYNCTQRDLPSNLWINFGKGKVNINKTKEGVEVDISTGAIVAFKNKDLTLEFCINLTPCKELSSNNILGLRIAETQIFKDYAQAIKEVESANMEYIIVSPGIRYYKYLNYPLEDLKGLAAIASEARHNNLSTGLKYGLRSISSKNIITKVFNGFSNELIIKQFDSDKNAPPKNMFERSPVVDVEAKQIKAYKDEQLLLRPQSRMNNYYVESLSFLQNAINLRCVSMKNPTIDSLTMERARKTLTKSRQNQGIIELELTSQFNKANAFSLALCSYAEVLPFVDKLWYNDNFDYSYDIYTLLLGRTGVPFGVATTFPANTPIALSLLFGALPKYGVESLSSEVINHFYKNVDKYDFINSNFYGFWDTSNPIRIDHSNVYASCFESNGNLLVSVFNYSDKKVKFEIGVETKLGVSVANKKVFAPFLGIEQADKQIDVTKPLSLLPFSGVVFFAIGGSRELKKKS
ncbi:MAG: glycoside hydrolase domain-containing protein [Christensenellales bacterium]|jgi:hypothetical protein|nr:hypothetical protein [Clostridiales bacterium]